MKPATAGTTPNTHSVKFKAGGIQEINKGEFVLNLKTKPSSATLIHLTSNLLKP